MTFPGCGQKVLLPAIIPVPLVHLEHQTMDYQLKGEDTMASIEKTEHVNSVILIKFVMNSLLYSNVIPLLIYDKHSYHPTVKIIRTI